MLTLSIVRFSDAGLMTMVPYTPGAGVRTWKCVSDILATPNSLKLRVGVGHRSRYPQNSKSVLAGSNSSKTGLTVRGMFTPSNRKWE